MKKTIPFRWQKNDYFCGPTCVQMVLARDGLVVSQERIARRMGTTSVAGTPRSSLARFLRGQGYAVLAVSHQTLRDLHGYLEHGWDVIVNYREPEEGVPHLAVAVAVSATHVVLHDPWHGPFYRLPRRDFLQRWNGYHKTVHQHWLLAARKKAV